LLMGSFRKLVTMDPGFRREGVLLVSLNLANTPWKEEERRSVHRQILERMRELPGVKSVGCFLHDAPQRAPRGTTTSRSRVTARRSARTPR
jgi:hypothetical protein